MYSKTLHYISFPSLSSVDFISHERRKKGSASKRIFGSAQNPVAVAQIHDHTRYIQTGGSVNNLSLVCAAVSATDIISSGPEAEMPPNSPLSRRCNYLTSPPLSSLFGHPLPTRLSHTYIHTYPRRLDIYLAL